ncbi:HTH_Tnp_Tc3_2 domain-containing protein [Trichonephila clavipes]|nr:HTH_Tnp_Tc3_2 domain-containing protein [Trichonephila clavipes]
MPKLHAHARHEILSPTNDARLHESTLAKPTLEESLTCLIIIRHGRCRIFASGKSIDLGGVEPPNHVTPTGNISGTRVLEVPSGGSPFLHKLLQLRIRAHYEQLSEFERGLINGLKEGGWDNRRIARHMGRSDATIRRCWQEWVHNGRFQHHSGSNRHWSTADQEDRLILRSAITELDSSSSTIRCWNHADWGRIVFSDKSRFPLCSDDDRRRPEQRAKPAFTIAPHTDSQQGELCSGGPIVLTAGPLWLSLDEHVQHIGTSTAF